MSVVIFVLQAKALVQLLFRFGLVFSSLRLTAIVNGLYPNHPPIHPFLCFLPDAALYFSFQAVESLASIVTGAFDVTGSATGPGIAGIPSPARVEAAPNLPVLIPRPDLPTSIPQGLCPTQRSELPSDDLAEFDDIQCSSGIGGLV